MTTTSLRNAIKSALADALSGYNVAWPGVPYSGARPYVEVSFPAADRTGGSLKGNEYKHERGRMAATVITDHGAGENAGLAIADIIDAAMYEGRNIAFTGGTISISAPLDIRGGYPTDADYRVRCIIRYTAAF